MQVDKVKPHWIWVTNISKSLHNTTVAVLKFSEVYFGNAGAKVFDVVLNNDHSIVSDLDIYAMVGKGVAYDEVIPFSISEGMLRVQVSFYDESYDGLSCVIIFGHQISYP